MKRTVTRLWWTALLVVIALGGAGLAVAADRPHNPLQRPERTWHADRAARPLIQALARELSAGDVLVEELSDHGREALGRITARDLTALNVSLEAGDATAAGLDSAAAQLHAKRAETDAAIDEWRLGPETADELAQLATATDSIAMVSGYWRDLAAHARLVAGLIDALMRHDGLVFQATTEGRAGNWEAALGFLDQAGAPLDQAATVRDELAAQVNVDTLNQLLDRYTAYDSALSALYAYIRDTGIQEGPDFQARSDEVERTQAALPTDTSAMTVIVAEAAGPPLTDALVLIEEAHGDALNALTAVETSE